MFVFLQPDTVYLQHIVTLPTRSPIAMIFVTGTCCTAMSTCWCPLLSRCGQQGSAGFVHVWDAGEDVQSGPAGLLRVPVQPLRLLRGVRRHRGDHPGGAGRHVSSGHLCVPLCPPATHLQGHTVRLGEAGHRLMLWRCFMGKMFASVILSPRILFFTHWFDLSYTVGRMYIGV